MKIGRNDLCPCGSEKKYKKCCLEKDEKDNISIGLNRNQSQRLDNYGITQNFIND